MSLYKNLVTNYFPGLPQKLEIAKMDQRPEQYLRSCILTTLYLGLGMGVVTFMTATQMGLPSWSGPAGFIFWSAAIFYTTYKRADAQILKRKKSIDRDVLFAGRFLLVKLKSGQSLINGLEQAAHSHGVASDYFKEIVDEINMGTNLEEALEKATRNCPSEKMQRILFQITNAIEIGIDVTDILESVLRDIAHEQMLEIKSYGEKLSSVALFYMLVAVVGPSLGVAMLLVVSSLISLNIGTTAFVTMGVIMFIIEFIFITVFKQIRPNVNI